MSLVQHRSTGHHNRARASPYRCENRNDHGNSRTQREIDDTWRAVDNGWTVMRGVLSRKKNWIARLEGPSWVKTRCLVQCCDEPRKTLITSKFEIKRSNGNGKRLEATHWIPPVQKKGVLRDFCELDQHNVLTIAAFLHELEISV